MKTPKKQIIDMAKIEQFKDNLVGTSAPIDPVKLQECFDNIEKSLTQITQYQEDAKLKMEETQHSLQMAIDQAQKTVNQKQIQSPVTDVISSLDQKINRLRPSNSTAENKNKIS